MFLVEIPLPVYDNEGRAFGAGEFNRVRDEPAARFRPEKIVARATAFGEL